MRIFNSKPKVWSTITIAILTLVCLSCGMGENDDDEEEDKETIASTSSSTGGTSSSSGASVTSANLATVQSNMLPSALSISSSSLALQDDPCANSDGFFDCQPTLVKLYLKIAKDILGHLQEVVSKSSGAINQFEVGTKGTAQPTEPGAPPKIDYDVTSGSDYTLILHSTKGPFIYLDVDETQSRKSYQAKWNSANAPDENGDEGMGNAQIDIDYVSDSDFNMTVRISDMTCKDEDVRAPEKLAIHINKSSGTWKAKAMIYQPRWLVQDGTKCSFTPTDSSKMFMYTDIISDEDSATASLYLMPSSVSSTSDFSNWPASDFCTNFSGSCQNGYGFGDPNPVSSYKNSFCATSSSATWNSECSGLAASDFSAASNWIVPTDLDDISVSVPSSL